MQTLRFKTNLKCAGCVKAITPAMESIKEILTWKVLLDTQDKILEIEVDKSVDHNISETIIQKVSASGYEISPI